MADLALNERLQPALLDRLIDDERTVALVSVVVERAGLERLQLPVQALIDILVAQGMTLQQQQEPAGDSWRFVSRHRALTPTRRSCVR